MIVRLWRGRADPARPDAYPQHFRENVLPELRATPGFLRAFLSRREEDGLIEFLVETQWAGIEAIRAFAGDAIDRAVVESGAVAALVDYDATVQHFEAVEEASL